MAGQFAYQHVVSEACAELQSPQVRRDSPIGLVLCWQAADTGGTMFAGGATGHISQAAKEAV